MSYRDPHSNYGSSHSRTSSAASVHQKGNRQPRQEASTVTLASTKQKMRTKRSNQTLVVDLGMQASPILASLQGIY